MAFSPTITGMTPPIILKRLILYHKQTRETPSQALSLYYVLHGELIPIPGAPSIDSGSTGVCKLEHISNSSSPLAKPLLTPCT